MAIGAVGACRSRGDLLSCTASLPFTTNQLMNKSAVLQIRLTQEERAVCVDAAKADGLTLSRWARKRLLAGSALLADATAVQGLKSEQATDKAQPESQAPVTECPSAHGHCSDKDCWRCGVRLPRDS